MSNFFSFYKKKEFVFFKIQMLLILFFGFTYYISDIFNYNNFDLAQKLGFVKQDITFENYNKPAGLDYYIWFSTITQTTVGFGGVIDADGNSIPFEKIKSNIFIFLNFCQLFSILLVPAFIV